MLVDGRTPGPFASAEHSSLIISQRWPTQSYEACWRPHLPPTGSLACGTVGHTRLMDDVFAGCAAGELRDGLRSARDLADMLHLVEERVAPYCVAARNAGQTEDGLAVSLGVSREFARALCALDPVAAIVALVSPQEVGVENLPSSQTAAEGWFIGWASEKH